MKTTTILTTTTIPEQTLSNNNNNDSTNKTTPIQNPKTTTPKDDFRKTTIDNLAKIPIDTATMTSSYTYVTTLTTIRRNTVLAASTRYIRVIYLTITKLDLIVKVYDRSKMDVLIINEIDLPDLIYEMVFVIYKIKLILIYVYVFMWDVYKKKIYIGRFT